MKIVKSRTKVPLSDLLKEEQEKKYKHSALDSIQIHTDECKRMLKYWQEVRRSDIKL